MQPTTPIDFSSPVMAQPDPARYAEDARLHVEFHRVPMLNQHKSREAGRAVYDEIDHVIIRVPGDKSTVIDAPVDAIYAQRFADRYAKWKAGQADAVTGTPLSAMPTMTPGKVAEYAYFNVKTVEQLAGAADSLGQKFMSFQADKARAKAWLEAAAGNAPVERLNTELAKRDEQIENLTTMLEALQAQVAKATTGKRSLTAEPAAA